MSRTYPALFCCCCVLSLSACSDRTTPAEQAEAKSSTPGRQETRATRDEIDTCALLTAEEVAEILGEPLKSTKQSDESEGGLRVKQCFYEMPTFTNSVSLRLVQAAAGEDARDPRQVWEETFAPEKLKEAGKRAPEPVPGIGDEAFWRSHRKGGALYVLSGNIYVRVAVENAEDKESKIRRCSEVARKALSRL